jgi:phosphoserine aminotransferase
MARLKHDRVHNFNPGPAGLPLEVLEQVQTELLNYRGTGMSVMEISHRSKEFEAILSEAEADLRALYGIPGEYRVLFLQGGASLQFGMIPANLRAAGQSADYIITGSWSKAALKDARKTGDARVAFSSEEAGFNQVPNGHLEIDPAAAYLYYCANETVHGIEVFKEPVAPEGVPLVADISSTFVSRPLDIGKFGLLYAGVQKNAGPAGVTVVIVHQDLLARTPANLPSMLDLRGLAEAHSLYNTPPCFGIYVTGLTLRWLLDHGGLTGVAERNTRKADLIYGVIDASGGFYRGHALPAARSRMNVTFRLPDLGAEKLFIKESQAEGLEGLKGHRSVGGIRASLYNAVTLDSTQVLADFMRDFQRRNG